MQEPRCFRSRNARLSSLLEVLESQNARTSSLLDWWGRKMRDSRRLWNRGFAKYENLTFGLVSWRDARVRDSRRFWNREVAKSETVVAFSNHGGAKRETLVAFGVVESRTAGCRMQTFVAVGIVEWRYEALVAVGPVGLPNATLCFC